MKLKIINLEGVYFEGDVESVNVNTSNGQLTILQDHLPLISNIHISCLTINDGNDVQYYSIAGGMLFVSEDMTKIITPAIENSNEIDISRAIEAQKRAQNRLDTKDENTDVKRAEVALLRAINRINTYDAYHVSSR